MNKYISPIILAATVVVVFGLFGIILTDNVQAATPAFYLGPYATDSITCGQSFTFRVDGYDQIWLTQVKNGAATYDGIYSVPSTYTSTCNQDEGNYSNYVYTVANAQRGNFIGYAGLEIKALPTQTQAPPPSQVLPTCSLSVSKTQIYSGERLTFTLNIDQAGFDSYWYGTKNGTTDVNGSSTGFASFSGPYSWISDPYPSSYVGNYSRYVIFRNSTGTACYTNSITVSVIDNPTSTPIKTSPISASPTSVNFSIQAGSPNSGVNQQVVTLYHYPLSMAGPIIVETSPSGWLSYLGPDIIQGTPVSSGSDPTETMIMTLQPHTNNVGGIAGNNLAPGTYTGKITIYQSSQSYSQTPVVIPVTLTVTNVTQPAVVTGTPVFTVGTYETTSATCGTPYSFIVKGYSASQIYLEQTKNGVSSYGGIYNVPANYTSICGKDEGDYVNKVYALTNGQKGTYLGMANFTIKSATVTATATPTITLTAPNGGEIMTKGGNGINFQITYKIANFQNLTLPALDFELTQNGVLVGKAIANLIGVYQDSVYWNFSWQPGLNYGALRNTAQYATGDGFKIKVLLYNNYISPTSSGQLISSDESDGTFSIISPSTTQPSVTGTPAFYLGTYKTDSATCGQPYTFRIDGYSQSQIYLVQTKNGISSYNGTYNVPANYTSVCGQDEGNYVNDVYAIANGQKGTYLGTANFTVKSALTTTSTDEANISGPTSINTKTYTQWTFAAKLNTTDSVLNYKINWGDSGTATGSNLVTTSVGTNNNLTSGVLIGHDWPQAGIYTITFTASSPSNPNSYKITSLQVKVSESIITAAPVVTRQPSPSTQPVPSTSPVTSRAIVDQSRLYTLDEIYDGDIIRGQGDIAVWIVKIVGEKRFKRWLFGPQIFKAYGHLGFDKVKNVSKETLSHFDSVVLIRKDDDQKVYELTDYIPGVSATRRWVPSVGVFLQRGFDFDSIYIVNDREYNFYNEGQPLQASSTEQGSQNNNRNLTANLSDAMLRFFGLK